MEKSDLIEILQRPVRNCELEHENVRRNEETDEPLLPLLFTPECDISAQHFGCVHLLDVLLNGTPETGYEGILSKILIETNDKLLRILREIYNRLTVYDNDMRQARTGKKFEDQLDEEDIPSSEAAIQASKETLIAHKRCMEELEALRPRILAIVQESA